MYHTDLFKFDFVDRSFEREKLESFLKDQYDLNFLWIDGASGSGKTFFIEEEIKQYQELTIISINLSLSDDSPNCLGALLEQLQKYTKISFLDFIQKNYISITDITKKVVVEILKLKDIKMEWLIDIIFDSNKIFVDHHKKKQTTLKVLTSYLEKIIKERNLLIILDNFTYCDSKSFEIIIRIFNIFSNCPNIKFIVITTHEVLLEKQNIEKFLLETFPSISMSIKPFDDSKLFYQILSEIFVMDTEFNDYVNIIFNICQGYPEKLKNIIRNLFFNSGIYYTESQIKAKIDMQMLKEYIVKESTDFDPTLLNISDRFILQVLFSVGKDIGIDVLIDMLNYVHKKIFLNECISSLFISESLEKLIDTQIIKNVDEKISIKHDLIFYALENLFHSSINTKQIEFYILQYIKNKDAFLRKGCFSSNELDYLVALLEYKCQIDGWVQTNFQLGKSYYNHSIFDNSKEIFSRLIGNLSSLSSLELLIICKCYYDAGDYQSANELIEKINVDLLSKKDKYDYFYYCGKIKSICLETIQAVNYFRKARNCSYSFERKIQAINMEQAALRETPNGENKARLIFESNIRNLDKKRQNPAICKLLKNCIFYFNKDKALDLLAIAEKLATQADNKLECAYIKNNIGFEYVRNMNLDEAEKQFTEAKDILTDIKIHDSAYSLNNLAVCKMFDSNYKEALDYLVQASFWSRSKYLSLSICVHKMMCQYYLNQIESSMKEAKNLWTYINSNNIYATTILRRTCINLSILYINLKDFDKARMCYEKGKGHYENTISSYRSAEINKILYGNKIENKNIIGNSKYYTNMNFEPWIVGLSHD